MALALVEVHFQLGEDADGRKSDALRAPAETPISGKDLYCPADIFIIVQRLAHTHKDAVGEFVALVNRNELGQYVSCREMAVETLAACHTETAAHPAAGLGRDT